MCKFSRQQVTQQESNLLGGNRLVSSSNGTGVDGTTGVLVHGLDDTLGLQLAQSLAGNAAVDLQAVNHGGGGDDLGDGDLLHHLLGGGLVQEDGVVGLLLGLSLGPLLFLALASGGAARFVTSLKRVGLAIVLE